MKLYILIRIHKYVNSESLPLIRSLVTFFKVRDLAEGASRNFSSTNFPARKSRTCVAKGVSIINLPVLRVVTSFPLRNSIEKRK